MNIKTEGKKTTKRFIALITILSMTMSLFPAFSLHALAAGEFSGGSGTQADPYIIETAEDLKSLADKVNAGEESYATAYYQIPTETYTYTKNNVEYTDGVRAVSIDLSKYDPWTPIGTEAHPFKGHFNGSSDKNHGNGSYGTIHHAKLQIDKGEYNDGTVQTAGIFGYVAGATIENVATSIPETAEINLNTYSKGETSYHCVGGLVGFAKDSAIKFCVTYSPFLLYASMGNDGGKKPELYVGGVIGGETGSEVFRCINNSVINVYYTEDDFEGNNVPGGKHLPDAYLGGIVGGVNGISSNPSKIHGSENMSSVTINAPHVKNADGIKLFAGGIFGGASGIGKDKLEVCQDQNRGYGATVNVSSSRNGKIEGINAVVGSGGITGYDDPEKNIHVHDCKNDAMIFNSVNTLDNTSALYASGIMAGHGNVDNCLNCGRITSMQSEKSSGICYSVPHHCYTTGMAMGYGSPICVEEPEDKTKNYYNYFTYSSGASHDSNWQHYFPDTQRVNNGELTWLLQGGQDSRYLHWTTTKGAPLLAGGYYVNGGGRPLDHWLNKSWSAYNNDMPREMVYFAYDNAWSYRIGKHRYVTTGKGNDGVDPVTGEDLKEDNSFASFEKSSTDQFYAIGYGYYCGKIGDMPSVTSTDEKTFIQWQTTPAASERAAVNLGDAFSNSGVNTTIYAIARVKYGARDDDGVYRSFYGAGNEIDTLASNVEYGAEPDTTTGKFTYTINDVTTENDAIDDASQYFTIDGETLRVAEGTPVGVYTVNVNADEKAPSYTLFSSPLGIDTVNFTLTAEVIKTDPEYTAPQAKQRVYDGNEADVITAGSTSDGKILYTLTPTDDTSWSESVPKASELGVYTVYWKIEGDANHNDISPNVVSGLIYPDSSNPANAIIVTPAAD